MVAKTLRRAAAAFAALATALTAIQTVLTVATGVPLSLQVIGFWLGAITLVAGGSIIVAVGLMALIASLIEDISVTALLATVFIVWGAFVLWAVFFSGWFIYESFDDAGRIGLAIVGVIGLGSAIYVALPHGGTTAES
jgi:hypothetical protein